MEINQKYRNLLISEDATVIDALKHLNSVHGMSRMIQFVYNKEGRIIGSLTDGDVRRSLINDRDVEKRIDLLCNRNFIYRYADESYINLEQYREKDIKIIPLLDKNHYLVEILDLDKVKSILPLEVVIMAGGRGERLRPLTDSVPKPMLPLGGKPIIEHNIDRLIQFGIKKIYISVKYLGQQIVDYFGDGSSKGIKIEYIWEDKPLGTSGALSLVEKFNTKYILLMNSDLFTDINFEDLYLNILQGKTLMTVATVPYTTKIPLGLFKLDGDNIVGIQEKPTFINYANAGIYLLDASIVKYIPRNKSYDITDLIQKLIDNKESIKNVPIIGNWIDIGQHQDYERAKEIVRHMQHSDY